MPRKARAKPKSPEQIAAEKRARLLAGRSADFAAVNLPSDGATLMQNTSVHVRRAGQRNLDTARRIDAFEALREGMPPGAYDAARRLERDITISRGEHDHGRPGERVQEDNETSKGRIDRMIDASKRVRKVLEKLSQRDQWLLTELITPTPGREQWRRAVAAITGERTPHGQAAAVRAACVNLRDAYERKLERAA